MAKRKKSTTPLFTLTPEQSEELSRRIKLGLQQAKRRGVKLGAPRGSRYLARYVEEHGNHDAIRGIQNAAEAYYKTIRPVLTELRKEHPDWTYTEIANELMKRGVKTRRGSSQWMGAQVQRLCVVFEIDVQSTTPPVIN